MSRILNYCNKVFNGNLPPSLPLVHSTEAFYFRSVIEECCLKTRKCPVFEEELLYFFYGKPAYKPGNEVTIRSEHSYLPICLILKPDSIGEFKAIYPFDTGAMKEGMYDDFKHKSMDFESFCLGNSNDILSKIVSVFFGNNKNYYMGQVKNDLSFDFEDMEAQTYYDIMNIKGNTKLDERRYTIEVQYTKNLELANNYDIIAVVLPSIALQDKKIQRTIIEIWDATPLTYDMYNASKPSGYNEVIRDIVKKFYEERKLI